MVIVSSPATCTDAVTVTLYPADVNVETSLAAGSANDSGISEGVVLVANVSHPLPHADVCDNVPPQHGVTELQEFEDTIGEC